MKVEWKVVLMAMRKVEQWVDRTAELMVAMLAN